MLKSYLSVAVFFILSLLLGNAQENNPLINSGETINAAIELRDSGKFDLAIQKLLLVEKSDTGYLNALTELASTYLNAEKYKEAIKTAIEVLDQKTIYKLHVTLIEGNAYDKIGFPDSSIAIYNRALQYYPNNYLLYFNLGITY